MGKGMWTDTIRTGAAPPRRPVVREGNGIPDEFRLLPRFLPPDMGDPANPDHLWMVCDEWMSPPVDGVRVCVRAPVVVGDMTFGFFTDGISVPQLAWTVYGMHPFSMPELCGAIGHDLVYSAELAPRKSGDLWMREWERMAGVGVARRGVIYSCVRTFGGVPWSKHAQESISASRLVCQLVKDGESPVWPDVPILG
jgi:hypothetical protein